MSKLLATKELRNMTSTELRREVKKQGTMVSALGLAVRHGNDKDSARFKRERRQLARMLFVLGEHERVEVKTSSPSAK